MNPIRSAPPLHGLAVRPAHGSISRWAILAIAWASLLMAFVDRLAWANLSPQMGGSLGLPMAGLGVFVTAFYIGYVGANVLGGLGADKLGPSRMLTCAMLPLGICTFLFSYTNSVTSGLALQFAMGAAAGADYSACVKLAASWFEFELRGRAMGLLFTASSLAVVITNATVPTLAASIGWSGVYKVLGTATCAVGILCWLFLRDAPGTADMTADKPHFGKMFRNRNLMLLSLAGFGALWGTWGFAFWVNALMINGHGVSSVKAGFITAMFGVGAIFAKPLIGSLSDWLGGRRKMLVIICLCCFTAMLLLFGSLDNESAFMIAAPILGITAFVYAPLMAAMVAESAGPGLVGSATGLTNAFWQLGNVVVPLAVGFAYQSTHLFGAAFATLAAGPLLGTLIMFAVRERTARCG